MDNAAVVARDTEELERLSPDLLVRLSTMVLRNAGLPPRKGVTAPNSACSEAVRLGAKPPGYETGAGATIRQNSSRLSVDKQGFLIVRPKITAACNLLRRRSQPTFPIIFEQAVPSYKNRPDSPLLSPSTLPVEKVQIRVAMEVP